jgi:hypothetical protein
MRTNIRQIREIHAQMLGCVPKGGPMRPPEWISAKKIRWIDQQFFRRRGSLAA